MPVEYRPVLVMPDRGADVFVMDDGQTHPG